jgi:hypothetical protein
MKVSTSWPGIRAVAMPGGEAPTMPEKARVRQPRSSAGVAQWARGRNGSQDKLWGLEADFRVPSDQLTEPAGKGQAG